MSKSAQTRWIIEQAKALGFDLCGVMNAKKFPELERTEEWLGRGYAGEMKYLQDPRRRESPAAWPGMQSVIVCAMNYNTAHAYSTKAQPPDDEAGPRGWISRYAWGGDYHDVLREKLEELCSRMKAEIPGNFETRLYADTGPVQERVAAKYAGLGWLGKNTLLLNQKLGSWFFLGVILTSIELDPTLARGEPPPPDLCGSCRRCIDACPTQAFVEPYVMDARRCIAYLTIELRGSIPEEFREPLGHHVFGCDICQDVCPWNRKAPVTQVAAFQPRHFEGEPAARQSAGESLLQPRIEWLASMSEEMFREVFRGSPVKRTKWRGLVRNACIALGNAQLAAGSPEFDRIEALLKRLSRSGEPGIEQSAQWALSRIQDKALSRAS